MRSGSLGFLFSRREVLNELLREEGEGEEGGRLERVIEKALDEALGGEGGEREGRRGSREEEDTGKREGERDSVEVVVVEGGYKAYRQEVLKIFSIPEELDSENIRNTQNSYLGNLLRDRLVVLGGYTGSGKTEILNKLKARGELVLDLEDLAKHRGSSFGALGQGVQPTREHFENLVFSELQKIVQVLEAGEKKYFWVEDESKMIGSCKIPPVLFSEMRQAPLVQIKSEKKNRRLSRIISEYGNFGIPELEASLGKLAKRIGSENFAKYVGMLRSGKVSEVAEFMLDYYDRAYDRGLTRRQTEGGKLFEFWLGEEEGSEISEEALQGLLRRAEEVFERKQYDE
jgi:tRNA 2-selenouridine synthase